MENWCCFTILDGKFPLPSYSTAALDDKSSLTSWIANYLQLYGTGSFTLLDAKLPLTSDALDNKLSLLMMPC